MKENSIDNEKVWEEIRYKIDTKELKDEDENHRTANLEEIISFEHDIQHITNVTFVKQFHYQKRTWQPHASNT